MAPSTAQALRTSLDQAAPAVHAATARLWHGPGLAERYAEYLRVMHGVVRASVPLMRLAARRCAERGKADPVAEPLRHYLTAHIAEETGHDDWLLADLAALGADPAEPLITVPPAAVARLVGAQYYWIEHHHPVALLGYIAVLEANAPTVQVADWVVATAGVPESAVRTVREHARLDGDHSDAVFDLLDRLPLTTALSKLVATSSRYTMDSLVGLFIHVVRASAASGPGKGDGP